MVPKKHNVGISWLLNSSIPTKIGTHRSFWIMLLFQLPSLHHPPQPEVLHLEPWTPKQRVHQRVPWSEIPGPHGLRFVTRGEKRAEKRGPKVAISWSGKECVQPLLKHTCREKGKDVPGGGKTIHDSRISQKLPFSTVAAPRVAVCGPLDLYIQPI